MSKTSHSFRSLIMIGKMAAIGGSLVESSKRHFPLNIKYRNWSFDSYRRTWKPREYSSFWKCTSCFFSASRPTIDSSRKCGTNLNRNSIFSIETDSWVCVIMFLYTLVSIWMTSVYLSLLVTKSFRSYVHSLKPKNVFSSILCENLVWADSTTVRCKQPRNRK